MTGALFGFTPARKVICPNGHMSEVAFPIYGELIAHVEPCRQCGRAAIWKRSREEQPCPTAN